MKQSLVVLALLGQASAVNLAKQSVVSADDFDNYGESGATPAHAVAQKKMDVNDEFAKQKNLQISQMPEKFDEMLNETEKELNMGLSEEKQLNNIERTYMQKKSKGVDAADRNIEQSEAKQDKVQRIGVDGLIHNDDGTLTDPNDGGPIDAEQVHKHHQKKHLKKHAHKKRVKDIYDREIDQQKPSFGDNYLPHHQAQVHSKHHKKQKNKSRKEDEDTINEAADKQKEVGAAAGEAIKNEGARNAEAAKEAAEAKVAAHAADVKRRFNVYDGNLHNANGSTQHVDNESIIDGANQGVAYNQVRSSAKDGPPAPGYPEEVFWTEHMTNNQRAKLEKYEDEKAKYEHAKNLSTFSDWMKQKDKPYNAVQKNSEAVPQEKHHKKHHKKHAGHKKEKKAHSHKHHNKKAQAAVEAPPAVHAQMPGDGMTRAERAERDAQEAAKATSEHAANIKTFHEYLRDPEGKPDGPVPPNDDELKMKKKHHHKHQQKEQKQAPISVAEVKVKTEQKKEAKKESKKEDKKAVAKEVKKVEEKKVVEKKDAKKEAPKTAKK